MKGNHDEIIDKHIERLRIVAQRSCFHSANRIPRNTRKYSGQARTNTRMARNKQNLRLRLANPYRLNAFRGTVAGRTRAFERTSKGIKLGDTVRVTNHLPYIRELEFKRGDLMFTRTTRLWQKDVNTAAKEANAKTG